MILEILRVYKGEDCTLGVVLLDGVPLCVSLELPWKGNKVDVSCIPEGMYKCGVSHSPNLGYITPELLNVHGRTHIRVHVGNFVEDILGCVAVGSEFAEVNGKKYVSESRIAFNKLKMETDNFKKISWIKVREI